MQFRKFAGTTSPSTLTLTVLLQSITPLFLFPLRLTSRLWYQMRPNFPFLSVAVKERRWAFAEAHKSEEDRQAHISASRHVSSVIAKGKTEVWQATSSSLSPFNLILNHSILSFVLSLNLLPSFPAVLLPRIRHLSSAIARDSTLLFPSQRRCAAEAKPTCPSFDGPHALRRATFLSALSLLSAEFLTAATNLSPRPLPLAEAKLLIP